MIANVPVADTEWHFSHKSKPYVLIIFLRWDFFFKKYFLSIKQFVCRVLSFLFLLILERQIQSFVDNNVRMAVWKSIYMVRCFVCTVYTLNIYINLLIFNNKTFIYIKYQVSGVPWAMSTEKKSTKCLFVSNGIKTHHYNSKFEQWPNEMYRPVGTVATTKKKTKIKNIFAENNNLLTPMQRSVHLWIWIFNIWWIYFPIKNELKILEMFFRQASFSSVYKCEPRNEFILT